MYKAAFLTLTLLLALVGSAQATEGHPIYGVKLCGREFIRAVIFTCGGSRWRRSLDVSGDLSSDLLSAHDDEASDSWSTNPITALSYRPRPQSEAPGWAREGQEGPVFSRPARSLISEEVLEALRTSDRKGRDVVVGLSNACCKWGCSKSEISSLC
ncbi:relaxin-3-like isoform X2 [Myxocyprinus asiaticus]|nr:relaxin-3-like isoform X2 [Myxocyprinus asiaticus]XP_051558246.1 relaxin-3-like isoform X2 [Myxocyprinus asiaticus]XP_051558247.1 relaxin-3-like isoform X2 [Myxocyprinus asiaticus]XP_051558248.1 relaxin-3-like isoform X2 [Myxocyprinus asiaticus]XP_051558249.1 relaxin-3-like isoform X2 [Myxocyprinus asiaticus]XP_051558250.1 relaxin-3-like isoform X2 [Myxocyprinus asiaticus]